MSVNYNATVLNNRLQVVASAIDAGGGNGVMRLLDSGGNILSSLALARPAANVASDYLFFNGLPLVDPAAAGSGFASGARVEDSTGAIVISGLTVGPPGGTYDLYLTSTTNPATPSFITAGQTVAISAAQIQGN